MIYLVNTFILFYILFIGTNGGTDSARFVFPKVCGDSQVNETYSFDTVQVTSLINCAVICGKSKDCYSFTYDDMECVLYSMVILSDCSTSVSKTKKYFFEKDGCMHEGTDMSDGTCLCKHGYIKERCHRLMTDCTEGLLEASYAGKSAELNIKPTTTDEAFPVYCTMKWGGRMYILYNVYPNTDLNRTWEEYKTGFGNLRGDHWLGLQKIHLITSMRNFKLTMEAFNSNNKNYKDSYSNFEIAGEALNYTLISAGSHSGPLSDCMTDLTGFPFATFDHGDSNSKNCALAYRGGWWYRDICARCNPVGELPRPTDGLRLNTSYEKFWSNIQWSPFKIKVWLQ